MRKFLSLMLLMVWSITLLTGCAQTKYVSLSPPPDDYRNTIQFYSCADWLDYEQGLKNTEKRLYDLHVQSIQNRYKDDPVGMAQAMAGIQVWSKSDQEVLTKLHEFRKSYTPAIPFYGNQPHATRVGWDSQYLFNLPWIYFYSKPDNDPEGVTTWLIMMTPLYPEWEIDSSISGRKAIDRFNPEFATKKTEHSSKGVEQTIQLGDRKVKAWTQTTKYFNSDATRKEYYFVYDDWFVCIYDYPQDESTTKFLSELTFKKVELDSVTGEIKAK